MGGDKNKSGFSDQDPSSVKQECEGWKLRVQVISGEEGKCPKKNVKISIGEYKDYRGRTDFRYTKFSGGKETPIDYVLSGKGDSTYYLSARAEEDVLWVSEITEVKLRNGDDKIVKIEIKSIELSMYLDEDRDGETDSERARCENWQWGECQKGEHKGAIIMVKTRNYDSGDEVKERMQIHLKWKGEKLDSKWEATLKVDKPHMIRIFDDSIDGETSGNREGAQMVIGPPSDSEDGYDQYEINGWAPIYSKIKEEREGHLWIEAVDFPDKPEDDAWEIKITLEFKPETGNPFKQIAMVRIAPWIMASDLDPTKKVFARFNQEEENLLPNAIKTWVGEQAFSSFDVPQERSKKGFARDVMKSGYSTAPHYSGVVIQQALDQGSPVSGLPGRAAKDYGHGTIKKPVNLTQQNQTPQDNGGNLLVSPPSDNDPYGRIIYGGRPHAADFYHAQRLQAPVRMDSTWLRVGHVDEMLSFVQDKNGTPHALLMSPRLAYIILRLLAGRQITSPQPIIEYATHLNEKQIQNGKYDKNQLQELLKGSPVPPEEAKPELYGHDEIIPAGFEEDPACPRADVSGIPAVTDTFVVFRINYSEVQKTKVYLGENYETAYRAFVEKTKGKKKEDIPFAQVRVQTRRFLQNFETTLLAIIDKAQPKLDMARGELEKIGFKGRIIEVPVLLRYEGADLVALSGDSVNMLVLKGGKASRCLVPKPFGPTAKGQYVYEWYLSNKLKSLGVEHKFLCDDAFHVLDGEIHCGTNQCPMPLEKKRSKWWEKEPPEATNPEPLPVEAPAQAEQKIQWEMPVQILVQLEAGCILEQLVKVVHVEGTQADKAEAQGDIINVYGNLEPEKEITIGNITRKWSKPYKIVDPPGTVVVRGVEAPPPEEPEEEEQPDGDAPPPPPPPEV